mgnify:CR=1 FL=1
MDAGLEIRVLLVSLGNRPPAGIAHDVLAFGQSMTDRDAVVENETVPAPFRFVLWNRFEVFQDSAAKVEDLIEALLLQ